jgi:hypothetical protein
MFRKKCASISNALFFAKNGNHHFTQPSSNERSTSVALLSEAMAANKPYFFSQNKWRHELQTNTVQTLVDPEKGKALCIQATNNLAKWRRHSASAHHAVEVLQEDWGVVGQRMSQSRGQVYAILNMANSVFVGGGFLSGMGAQEENMWTRTTCGHYILEELDKHERSGIYLDESTKTFQYKKPMSDLINAHIDMTSEELTTLSALRGMKIDCAKKVYLNPNQPRICFRGLEVAARRMASFDEGMGIENYPLLDTDHSFLFLKPDDVFLFYELRAAAPELGHLALKAEDDMSAEYWTTYRTEIKQRIDAQLDTCILHGISHVILGAFGCGAFKNHPVEVANIYRQSILERANHFQHIVFAIYDQRNDLNFNLFKQELHDLKLNDSVDLETGFSSRMILSV